MELSIAIRTCPIAGTRILLPCSKKRAKLQEPPIAIADMHVIFRRHWNEESFNVMSDHGRYLKTSPELSISDM